MESTGLQIALDAAGSQSRLAEICGVSQPTVWGWINKGRKIIPAEYVLACERELGISRHDLRPDLYPRGDTGSSSQDCADDFHTRTERRSPNSNGSEAA